METRLYDAKAQRVQVALQVVFDAKKRIICGIRSISNRGLPVNRAIYFATMFEKRFTFAGENDGEGEGLNKQDHNRLGGFTERLYDIDL